MRRDEKFSVGDSAELEIDVPAGNLRIAAGAPNVVHVSIDARDTEPFEVTQIGDTISIREDSRWRSRNRHVRVVVEAPPHFDLVVRAASANIETRGQAASVAIQAASGDVEVDRAERLDATTASGGIRVGTVSGDVRCKTASGDVVVQSADGELDASTASGDVDAAFVADQVQIGTASGSVDVARCDGESISIKTISGSIRLGLPTGIRVEPDLVTMSGKVTVPVPARGGQSEDRRTVRVRLNSVSGNIRIERAS